MTAKKNKISIVKAILQDEVRGDVSSALKKMHKNYTMTWVDTAFRKFKLKALGSKKTMENAYSFKGRNYDIKNTTESKNTVMVELVESYKEKDHIYTTPLVLVLEFKGNKIVTGRHYCDPQLSKMKLTKRKLNQFYSQ